MRAVDIAGAAGVILLCSGLWLISPPVMMCAIGAGLICASVKFNKRTGSV